MKTVSAFFVASAGLSAHFAPARDQIFGASPRSGVNRERITRGKQVAGHGMTHDSQTDECDRIQGHQRYFFPIAIITTNTRLITSDSMARHAIKRKTGCFQNGPAGTGVGAISTVFPVSSI